jgi:anthranilate synthase/phosphoribosyltransferase
MVLMIDNYDSFTYNVVDLLRRCGEQVTVRRSRSLTVDEIEAVAPDYLVISPGPGRPEDAGVSLAAVRTFAGRIPILGICLGHQVIIEAFGGRIIQAPTVMHGKTDVLLHDSQGIFRNIAQNLPVVRYHSLAADQAAIPADLEVTARAQTDQAVMGIRHAEYLVEGVQFHPESIGTQQGMKMIQNFLSRRRGESPVTAITKKLTEGQDLTGDEAYEIMDEITNGELSDGQIGAFLGSMAVKGVTPTELSQFARVLLAKTGAAPAGGGLLDTCGTGGDGQHTFNISTAAALVCAAAGVQVAKHGNKAVSSKSGSYDFLKALNIPVEQPYESCIRSLREHSFTFLYAPLFHRAMRHVGRVRQELRVRTLFNMIGPLVNPLRPEFQVAGVYSEELLDLYAETMRLLGVRRALVVHSCDHLDEISIAATTSVRELAEDGTIRTFVIDPGEFGITGYSLQDLAGGNADENVALFHQIISGSVRSRRAEAVLEAVCLNAGAGLSISGTCGSLHDGYRRAKEIVLGGELAAHLSLLTGSSGDMV